MIPAVIYARVSSKDQEREGYSIPAQLKLLREYAQSRYFNVAKEFVDVETAKILGGHPKTGHMWSLQNRPTERTQNMTCFTLS